jgi:YD repeat-containing protein
MTSRISTTIGRILCSLVCFFVLDAAALPVGPAVPPWMSGGSGEYLGNSAVESNTAFAIASYTESFFLISVSCDSLRINNSFNWIMHCLQTYQPKPGSGYLNVLTNNDGVMANASCPANASLSFYKNECDCNPGFSELNGQCVSSTEIYKSKNFGVPKFCKVCAGMGNTEPGRGGYVGDPITVATGNMFLEEADIVIPGSPWLRFVRTYNSQADSFGGIGTKWRHNFALRVLAAPSGAAWAQVYRSDGKIYEWHPSGSDWVSEADVSDKLTEIKDLNGARTGWEYTKSEDDSKETYDADGYLRSIIFRSGVVLTASYDSYNKMTSVSDSFGRSLTFQYETYGRIKSVTDPVGNVYEYVYDLSYGNSGNLIGVTFPDNKSKTYVYENQSFSSALTGVVDEKGTRYISWTYDSVGRAISNFLAGSVGSVGIAYNADGSAVVTDALGASRTFSFEVVQGVAKHKGLTQPPGVGSSASYLSATTDLNGNVASRTNANGITTTYTYDLARNLETVRTEASGTANARTVSTAWHPTFRLPAIVTEPLRKTSFSYDAHGNLLSKSIVATLDSNGSQGLSATPVGSARGWSYSYDGFGRPRSITGPRTDVSDVTTLVYDQSGAKNLLSVTNAAGHVTSFSGYDANGRVGTITDPNGLVTAFSYALRGWVNSISVMSSGTGSAQITSFEYDDVGQMTATYSPDGSTLSYVYDDAHRLKSIKDSAGNSINYTLDGMGNRVSQEVKDQGGVLTRKVSSVFDALGRLQQITGGAQ